MRWWLVLLFVPISGCISTPTTLLLGWNAPPGDAAPVAMADCEELLDVLQARALDEAGALLDQSVEGHGPIMWAMEDAVMPATATSSPRAMETADAASGGAHAAQVTGTNNQEVGVDEADFLKTDGEWTYVLQGGILYIMHSEAVGDIQRHASVTVGGWDGALLLEKRAGGDRLLVITTHGTDEAPVAMDGWLATRVRTYSLADRAAPAVTDDRWLEGEFMGARLVAGVAYVVVHKAAEDLGLRTWAWPDDEDLAERSLTWQSYNNLPAKTQSAVRRDIAADAKRENARAIASTDLDDHLPVVATRTTLGYVVEPALDPCGNVLVVPEATGRGTNTVLALDLAATGSSTTQVVGGRPIVYGSGDALVLAANSRDLWWLWQNQDIDETTDVQWFDLDGLTVTPRASGRVPGTVLDSFSIDEQDGRLRIATTTGQWARWWDDAPEPMVSHLVVMEEVAGALVPTGIVGGIAPTERIWSARFTEDRAYIITFRQVDPLWVIDLSDPTAPTILGELEIEGVSTYLHPLSDDLLLTIGYGGTAQGLDWGRIQVSLFDVSDPTSPRRADVLDLSPPDAWAHSLAVDEHKAFTYWDALGRLAVPISSYEGDVGVQLVAVDTDRMDLELAGFVDQDPLTDGDSGGPEERMYYGYAEVQRTYFYGMPGTPLVSLYAMSALGITVHDLRTLQDQAHVRF